LNRRGFAVVEGFLKLSKSSTKSSIRKTHQNPYKFKVVKEMEEMEDFVFSWGRF